MMDIATNCSSKYWLSENCSGFTYSFARASRLLKRTDLRYSWADQQRGTAKKSRNIVASDGDAAQVARLTPPACKVLLFGRPFTENVGERPVASRGLTFAPRTATWRNFRGHPLMATSVARSSLMAKEDTAYQTASAGRRGQSVAADRSRARPTRPQHHGILQAVQCHRAIGKRHADPGRHHRVSGPQLHLHRQPPNSFFIKKAAQDRKK